MLLKEWDRVKMKKYVIANKNWIINWVTFQKSMVFTWRRTVKESQRPWDTAVKLWEYHYPVSWLKKQKTIKWVCKVIPSQFKVWDVVCMKSNFRDELANKAVTFDGELIVNKILWSRCRLSDDYWYEEHRLQPLLQDIKAEDIKQIDKVIDFIVERRKENSAKFSQWEFFREFLYKDLRREF